MMKALQGADGDRLFQPPTRRFVVLSAILGALLGLFFLAMLVFNFTDSGDFVLLLFFFTAAAGAALACISVALGNFQWPRWAKRTAAVCGVLLLLAVQLRLAKALYGEIAYDFNYVYGAARALASNGTMGGVEEYFARFPNNVFLAVAFSMVVRICGILGIQNLMAALVGCNLVAVDLSILLTVFCARKMFGNRAAVLTMVFSVPLIGLHYGIVCPYSDTIGMLFPVLFLFLYLHLPEKGAAVWVLTALMGVSVVVGFQVKPQTMIIAVAVALAEFFYSRLTKERLLRMGKRALCFFGAVLVISFSLSAVMNAVTGKVLTKELKAEHEAPFTHYFMMGLNPDTTGFFSTEDWAATNGIAGKDAKTAYNLQVAGERLQRLGPVGYAKFLLKKGRYIFHDMKMDMWVRAPFLNQDPLSTALQEAFCQGGKGFAVHQRFLQALWVLILLLWVLPVVFCRGGIRDKRVAILRLTVMGLTLFLLLFEAGPRYLFHQFPLFILLAVWGMQALPGGVRDTCRRMKEKAAALKARRTAV